MRKMTIPFRPSRARNRLTGPGIFVSLLAVLFAARIPTLSQSDASRARSGFLAIQRQVDSVETRIINSTVALELGGVSGSGVIISNDGYVLTAAHVIAGRH